MIPQSSNTEWGLRMQSKNNASKQKMLMRTDKPTKTVAALKAGPRMDSNASRLPVQLKLSPVMAESSLSTKLGLLIRMQNFHRPNLPWPLLSLDAPTQSSLRKATMWRMVEQKANTLQITAIALDSCEYFDLYLVTRYSPVMMMSFAFPNPPKPETELASNQNDFA